MQANSLIVLAIIFGSILLFSAFSIDLPQTTSTGEAITPSKNIFATYTSDIIPSNEVESFDFLEGQYFFTEIENFGPENFATEHADYINSQGILTKINFQQKPAELKYGDIIRVEGSLIENTSFSENKFNATNVEILSAREDNVIAGVEENPSLGEQKIAVILINSIFEPDYKPYTKEEIYNYILNPENPPSTNSWIKENSYNKAWLAGNVNDIYGYYSMVLNNATIPNIIDLIDPDIDFAQKDYRRLIVIIFISDSNHMQGQSFFIGLYPIQTDEGLRNMGLTYNTVGNNNLSSMKATRLIRHELGHNFGARHSASYDCGTQILGNNCTFFSYGDMYDVMGSRRQNSPSEITTDKFHINSVHKEVMGWGDTSTNLGWFNPGNVIEVSNELQNYGNYTLKPVELPTNELQVIKTPSFLYSLENEFGDQNMAETKYYYLEFRDKIGFDSEIEQPFVLLHLRAFDLPFDEPIWELLEGSGNSLQLFGNNGTAKELIEGEEFIDELSNLKIKVNEIGEHYANVNISQFLAVCGNNIVQPGEICDSTSLAGNSCQSLGYESGSLSCCPTCGSFDKSGCGYDLSTCTDNDSGASNQYLVQSTVTGANQTFTGQACNGWANATNAPYTYIDSCNGNVLTEWSCVPEIVPSIYDCNAIDCTQFKKPVSQTIDCTAIGWLCGNGKCTGVTGGGGKKGPLSPSAPSPNEPIQ